MPILRLPSSRSGRGALDGFCVEKRKSRWLQPVVFFAAQVYRHLQSLCTLTLFVGGKFRSSMLFCSLSEFIVVQRFVLARGTVRRTSLPRQTQTNTLTLRPGFYPPQVMKNIIRLSASALAIFFASSNNASAQATATASASATIVTPISIAKSADMHFGNVAVNASQNGTVVLAPAGSRTATGGVTLPATVGSPAAASFTVSGEANYTYAITLPSANITLADAASNTMDAGSFTSSPSATGTLSASGSQILNVGATLQVIAGQAAGTYTTAQDFEVTVNYN